MRAGLRVQTRVGNDQPLDRLVPKDMGFNNLINIRRGYAPVPDSIRIDHNIGAVLTLLHATCFVGLHHRAFDAMLRQFSFEGYMEFGFAGGIAGTDEPPSDDSGNVLREGDYVSTHGKVITYGELDGARVYWFVERTQVHNRSSGSPQFSYTDPDANLPDDMLDMDCRRIMIE